MNVVNLMGHLGADPEVRFTSDGSAVANLRLATSSYSKGQQYTEWHRVVAFGKTAEIAKDHLAKGSAIAVEGRIQTKKWQDRDGQDRYTTEIVANRIHFAGKKQGSAPSQAPAEAPSAGADFDDDIPFDVCERGRVI